MSPRVQLNWLQSLHRLEREGKFAEAARLLSASPGGGRGEIAPFLLEQKKRLYGSKLGNLSRAFNSFPQSYNPLISVIIVAYNSREYFQELCDSLIIQTYNHLEIIILDAGKQETLIPQSLFDTFSVVYRRIANIGFAAASNLGVDMSKGDLVFLMNPDATLDSNSLSILVNALKQDNSAAIAAPLICFEKNFIHVEICSPSLKIFTLKFLQGQERKLFVKKGRRDNEKLISNERGEISFLISDGVESIIFEFESSGTGVRKISISSWPLRSYVVNCANGAEIRLDRNVLGSGIPVVNNAGSDFKDSERLKPYDRFFGVELKNLDLNTKYVKAFCGCAALIRREVFFYRKLFIEDFFMYFEDSELSEWMWSSTAWKIRFEATSLVRHRLSETIGIDSPIRKALIQRSRSLYQNLVAPKSNPEFLQLKDTRLLKQEFPNLSEIQEIKVFNRGSLYRKQRPVVGVFNRYFNSAGGGERRALEIASQFLPFADVYLISTFDFSIPALQRLFQINLCVMRKLVIKEITADYTAQFDVFINSTFHSNLVSKAKKSFYLVSFPHQHASQDFLTSYLFIHNSEYTKNWAENYWGVHRSTTIYPCLTARQPGLVRKQRNFRMLSVGRFSSGGHCKNHHVIIDIFTKLKKVNKVHPNWELTIAGSVDETSQDSKEYFDYCEKLADGVIGISIEKNISDERLRELYETSWIYVSCVGIGADGLHDDPSRFEHFGISVTEAMLAGLLPVVCSVGGPAEQLSKIQNFKALTYENKNDLLEKLNDIVCQIQTNAESTNWLSQTLRKEALNLVSVSLAATKRLVRGCFQVSNGNH